MKPKKIISSILLGCTIASTSALASNQITLNYAEGTPNRGIFADGLTHFAERVDEKSSGDIKIKIHWGGALVKYTGVLQAVSSGTADMGTALAPYSPQKLKGLGIGDLPVRGVDPWVGMRAMYELMTTNEQMLSVMDANDVVYIGNFTTASAQLECAGENRIESLDDLKGMRVRASSPYADILNELGATVVNFDFSEVYQALSTGLTDCSAGYLYTMRSFKTPEVTSSVTMVNWGQISGFAMIVNKWVWDSLADDQKALMRDAASETIDHFSHQLVMELDDVLKKLPTGELGNKIDVIYLETEERNKLLSRGDRFVESWISDMNSAGYDGQALWESYTDLIEKYQKELDDFGYPWNRS